MCSSSFLNYFHLSFLICLFFRAPFKCFRRFLDTASQQYRPHHHRRRHRHRHDCAADESVVVSGGHCVVAARWIELARQVFCWKSSIRGTEVFSFFVLSSPVFLRFLDVFTGISAFIAVCVCECVLIDLRHPLDCSISLARVSSRVADAG
jgi:hypothetical protein